MALLLAAHWAKARARRVPGQGLDSFLGSLDEVGCDSDVCQIIVLALNILRFQQGTGLFSGRAVLI